MNGTRLKTYGSECRIGKARFRAADLVFGFVFILVAVWLFLTAADGITVGDETLWQHFCARVAGGDRLFADDWTLSNQVTFFTYLPFRLFTAVTGGTEGVVLFLRFVYIAVKLIVFLYLYLSLREYGFWAVFAGVFYAGTDLFAIKTTGYYSVCVNAVLLAGMLLFVHQRRSPLRIVFAAFLFSCAVVAEPPLAAVWVLYSALVLIVRLIRRKNAAVLQAYDFILEPKTWRLLFYGVCAAVLTFLLACALFFTGMDLRAIAAGMREILQIASVESESGASMILLRAIKIRRFLKFYGAGYSAAFLLTFLLATALHKWTKRFEKALFAVLSVLFVLLSVNLLRNSLDYADASGECSSHPLLICLLAVAAYVFTENRNRKLFSFLLLSFAVSVMVDLFSNNAFGSVLLAGVVPAVCILRDFYVQQRASVRTAESASVRAATSLSKRKKEIRNRKAAGAYAGFLAVMVCIVPALEVCH